MLYVVIVVGIVLGSSLGYNMPISVLIAKVFHERRSLAFGIFRMGPGISVHWCRWWVGQSACGAGERQRWLRLA